jgi:hypothetical protein
MKKDNTGTKAVSRIPASASAEFRLIVEALTPQPPRTATNPATFPVIDWPGFLSLARGHAIRPLIHKSLKENSLGLAVPAPLISSLTNFAVRNDLRNTIAGMELVRLIRSLECRGIPAVTFKGPMLAQQIFGNVSLREFLDIDILVPLQDFPAAEKILRAEGYESLRPAAQHPGYLNELGQTTFRRPGESFCVDLHWKLASFGVALPFTERELWSGVQKLPLVGLEAPTLAWDHLALFLAFHGAKERWRSLKWACDFAQLVRCRPELDWTDLLRRSARNQCSRDLLVAAQLIDALGFAAPPALLAQSKKSSTVTSRTDSTLRELAHPRPENDLSIFLYTLQGVERIPAKIRLTAKLFSTLTVSDFAAVRLPRRLYWLYFLIRPVRLAGKVLSLAFGRARSFYLAAR